MYINEANEYDFKGKAVPFKLYSTAIKSLQFEILENTVPIPDNTHQLSTGIGFYYKASNGTISEITQNQTIPVSGTQYSLYYGNNDVLGATDTVNPSRTMVVYSTQIDDFVVRFDPNWKTASVTVFDMSGRSLKSKNNLKTVHDYPLELLKTKSGYLISITSDKGDVVTTKILR